jgi:hypothetical protein
MNPNNPDINDLLNSINKKRKRGEQVVKQEDIIMDLRILSLEKLENMFKGKKLSQRETSKLLSDLEYTMTSLKVAIEDSEIDNEFDNISKALFLSMLSIHVEEIVDIRKASDKEGRTFNALDYIKTKREKLESELEKKLRGVNTKKAPPSKRMKKDDYESDSSDDSSDEEDDKDDDEEDDEDEEEYNHHTQITSKMGKEFIEQLYRGKGSPHDLEDETLKYFTSMTNKDRKNALDKLKEINNYENKDKPVIFQIMELDLPVAQKNHILKNYMTIATSRYENNKLKQWVDGVMQIPFGKYKGINLDSIKPEKVKDFLNDLQKSMDKAAYGHDEAKRQIIQMMGQQIRNPKAKGNMLGLWGPPGNGKCFAKDTQILMFDGTYKNVQDIQVGEVIMGDDSKPRNVLSLGRGIDDMYEISPNKGESYTVNSEHILCLKSSGLDLIKKTKYNKFKVQYFDKKNIKMKYKNFDNYEDASQHLESLINDERDNIIEITIKDYLKLSNHIKNKLKGYKTGVEFSRKDVDFDPYIIGLWLGDGSTDKPLITNQDSRILLYLRNELKKYDLN